MEQDVMQALSFEDLNDHVTFNVLIPRPGGKELRVQMRTLSYSDLLRIERDTPMPAPKIIDATSDGKKVFEQPSDPAYKQRVSDVMEKRRYRQLLASLVLTVPGDTEEAQIEHLRTLDAPLLMALVNAFEQAHYMHSARIEGRAQSFHDEGAGDLPGVRDDGLDVEPV